MPEPISEVMLRSLDFVRFTDAKVGRAFKAAIAAWHNDMKIAEYTPSDLTEEAFKALGLCVKEAIDEAAIIELVPALAPPAPIKVIKANDPEDELYDGILPAASKIEEIDDIDDEGN